MRYTPTFTERNADAAMRAFQPAYTVAQLYAMRAISDEGLQAAREDLRVARNAIRRDRRLSIAQPDFCVWTSKLGRDAEEVRRYHARVRKFRAAVAVWDARIDETAPQFAQAAE